MERSLTEIVRRHEALRTTFPVVQYNPVQVIASAAPAALSRFDLGAVPETEQAPALERLIDEESGRAFDLERGPLLRVTLVRFSALRHVLIVAAHHIILDGWSVGIFRRELAALYSMFASGSASTLPDLTVQNADFAIWQQENTPKEAFEAQIAYWQQQLKDLASPMRIPVARERPAVMSFDGARRHFELPATLADGLRAFSRRNGLTLFMTLLAGFQILLYRYCAETDIAVGTVVANRNRQELEGLIGFFVNTLVMRCNLDGDPTVRELLQRVKDTALAAYDNQEIPFASVVEALRPTRSATHHPLFQVAFNLQNTPKHTIELPELVLSQSR